MGECLLHEQITILVFYNINWLFVCLLLGQFGIVHHLHINIHHAWFIVEFVSSAGVASMLDFFVEKYPHLQHHLQDRQQSKSPLIQGQNG